jgi:hypothetical protein
MNDRPANGSGNAEPPSMDIDAATRRLMMALDSLESAVERTNREIADRLDAAIDTIRSVLDAGEI